MKLKCVEAESIETLEHYAVALVLAIMSLKNLEKYHSNAIEKGILTDDMITIAKVLIWDTRRSLQQYREQFDTVMALLPDGINVPAILEALKERQNHHDVE